MVRAIDIRLAWANVTAQIENGSLRTIAAGGFRFTLKAPEKNVNSMSKPSQW